MSGFINRTAGMMAQMQRAIPDLRNESDNWNQWVGIDTSQPWADAVLWPNSRGIGCCPMGNDASNWNRWNAPPELNGGQQMLKFKGITRDSTGAVLGLCTVKNYLTSNDQELRGVVSDAGGYFELPSEYPGVNHYLVAYKAGSPAVTGASANTLQPA